MPIEDVFTITGRGTVVTGKVERGIDQRERRRSRSSASSRSRSRPRSPASRCSASCSTRPGPATTPVCCCVAPSAKRSSAARSSSSRVRSLPHTEFEAQVYILGKDEGGRHTPFFNNYRPQFFFRTTDVTGVVSLPEGTEMVMPGDTTEMKVAADPADRHRGRPALRHPRGRPHRRCRFGHQDRQVVPALTQALSGPGMGRLEARSALPALRASAFPGVSSWPTPAVAERRWRYTARNVHGRGDWDPATHLTPGPFAPAAAPT